MPHSQDTDVLWTLRYFKSAGLRVSFLVPTATGLEKSIMDATLEIREFLLSHKLHDFSKQQQGQDHKVSLNTALLSKGKVEYTKTSLYRPNTKSGDPRIWVLGLKALCNPYDLLALIASSNGLVIINCNQSNLHEILDSKNVIFKEIITPCLITVREPAKDLLEKMEEISSLGFIQTKRRGDTGIGYTLETLLGISANNSRAPDYRGIEIKSKRYCSGKGRRSTIFSQVPNWDLSRLKSSRDLLSERGRFSKKKNRVQLFHELSTLKSNSFDMRLLVDTTNDQLQQIYTAKEPHILDVLWDFPLLKRRLSEKHSETFWVTAETKGKNGAETEEFWYNSVKHTGGIDLSAFPILLDLGVITLDYTIKATLNGGVKDQGYLFKMNSTDLDLLFNHVTEYNFAT